MQLIQVASSGGQTNASGAMWLPNLVQVTESSSGSVVPLAMFSENIRKTETSFFQAIFFNDDKEESSCRAGNVYLPLCPLSLSLFISPRQNRISLRVCVRQIKTVHFALNIGPGGRWTENAPNFTTLSRVKDIWPDFINDWHKFSPNQRIELVQSHYYKFLGTYLSSPIMRGIEIVSHLNKLQIHVVWCCGDMVCAEINRQILSKLRPNKTKQQTLTSKSWSQNVQQEKTDENSKYKYWIFIFQHKI